MIGTASIGMPGEKCPQCGCNLEECRVIYKLVNVGDFMRGQKRKLAFCSEEHESQWTKGVKPPPQASPVMEIVTDLEKRLDAVLDRLAKTEARIEALEQSEVHS